MKAYLCGPMSGMPEGGFPVFRAAAEMLRRDGHDIVSPVEMNEADGEASALDPGHPRRSEFLARDVACVADADIEAVIALPGWEHSSGCRLEVTVAQGLGKPILSYPTLEDAVMSTSPVATPRHPASARFHEIVGTILSTHVDKMADYGRDDDPFANVRGSEEWGLDGWVGAMVRATDKVRRLQTYARTGHLRNEGVMDAFVDLASYAVIAAVLWEEQEAA